MTLAYKTRDVEQYTNSLAKYLPDNILFAGKNVASSNIRKFLKGLSYTLFNVNGAIKEFTDDYLPDETEKFISEWETAVGIPDDIFSINEIDATRRLQIIAKLSYMACQIGVDFVELAALFGITVTVTPGIEDVSGVTAGLTNTEKRFTIVINYSVTVQEATFPMTFPFVFGESDEQFIEKLFNFVDPSNCQVLLNTA